MLVSHSPSVYFTFDKCVLLLPSVYSVFHTCVLLSPNMCFHSTNMFLFLSVLFTTNPEGPWNKTHVTCSSHTWFIYNLNTILLLTTFTQYHDTYTQIDDNKPWRNPLLIPPCQFPLLIPLDNSPFSWVPPTYLESLLFAWCDPRPPWSQVACKLTSPSPFPPHSIFPPPMVSPIQLCAPLRRHHDTDFIKFGTSVCFSFYECLSFFPSIHFTFGKCAFLSSSMHFLTQVCSIIFWKVCVSHSTSGFWFF